MATDQTAPWFLQLVLTLVPVILAPAVSSYLSQLGAARRAQQFEQLLKRAELIDRLRALDAAKDQSYAAAINAEVDDILGDLKTLRESEQAVPQGGARVQALRHHLLLFDQPTRKGRVYKALFLTFVAFAASYAVLPRALEGDPAAPTLDFGVVLYGVIAYLVIALVFRAAALREYRRISATRLTTSAANLPGSNMQPI